MFQGPKLMEVIAGKVIESGVTVVPRIMITDLLTINGEIGERVVGAAGFDGRTGEFKVFEAKATIIAAGACSMKARFAGQRFETGDTYAMAYRAGAKLGGLELGHLMQTTCTDFDTQGLNMFVGLGGQFINNKGESFMLDYDPELGNHSSMSRLSEASAMEVRAGRGPIYLDMTFFTSEEMKLFKTALPLPMMIMERAGVIVDDRIVKKMEWAPAWRGLIAQGGGVVVNRKCEASLPGLYACGDAMERHKHPPLGLPGAAVTGARAGRFAAEYIKDAPTPRIHEKKV
jgi:succinate dehydrogenase/fumarate reductase flavoprotein subunit